MKRQFVAVAVVAIVASLVFGCASKGPVIQDGKQVAVFVLSDRGIKSDMKEDESKDRNEMGQFMEENLIEMLKDAGYNPTLIQKRNQYVPGSANYLVIVRINDLRMVSGAARFWVGMMAGTTILKNHYELSGSSGKVALSYDDEDSTTRDWTKCAEELNERLVKKIGETLSK